MKEKNIKSCVKMEKLGLKIAEKDINLEELKSALRKDTLLCSVIHVNNEIGVMQPLKEIGALCKANKTFFDAA